MPDLDPMRWVFRAFVAFLECFLIEHSGYPCVDCEANDHPQIISSLPQPLQLPCHDSLPCSLVPDDHFVSCLSEYQRIISPHHDDDCGFVSCFLGFLNKFQDLQTAFFRLQIVLVPGAKGVLRHPILADGHEQQWQAKRKPWKLWTTIQDQTSVSITRGGESGRNRELVLS